MTFVNHETRPVRPIAIFAIPPAGQVIDTETVVRRVTVGTHHQLYKCKGQLASMCETHSRKRQVTGVRAIEDGFRYMLSDKLFFPRLLARVIDGAYET